MNVINFLVKNTLAKLPVWALIALGVVAVIVLWNILAIVGAIIGLFFWIIGTIIHFGITAAIAGLIIWAGFKVCNFLNKTFGKETIGP